MRVESKKDGKSSDLIVLANSGAESVKPCIVAEEIAKRIDLWFTKD